VHVWPAAGSLGSHIDVGATRGDPDSLNSPREGDFVDVFGHLACVKAASARLQAKFWNTMFADDPLLGGGPAWWSGSVRE
jgi:hypothetical protein